MLNGNMLCGVEVGRFMFRVGKQLETKALAKPGAVASLVFSGRADGRPRLGRRGGLPRPCARQLDRVRLAFRRHATAEIANEHPAVAGSADAGGDQPERRRHQHPAGMAAARAPQVGERAAQIEAADAEAGDQPRSAARTSRPRRSGQARPGSQAIVLKCTSSGMSLLTGRRRPGRSVARNASMGLTTSRCVSTPCDHRGAAADQPGHGQGMHPAKS